jgi:hypothetical protein
LNSAGYPYEGDFSFSLPNGSAQSRFNQEKKMKSRRESVKSTKAKAAMDSARQGQGAPQAESPAGRDDCPREQMIAEAAYFRAEQRGFSSGNEMSDWLEAEASVESSLGS